MGYRLLVAVAAVVFLAGCSAFDSDNTPYEGLPPGEVMPAPGASANLYSGYYSGDMKVETNTCQTVADEVGSAIAIALEVVQSDTAINVLFDEGAEVAGTLTDDKVTIMVEEAGVKEVYYLTFADEELNGNAEAIEADANGQYGDPCATYTVALAKGEKPAEEEGEEGEGEAEPKVGTATFK